MGWANHDLALVLDNSSLSLNDLITPTSIKTLKVSNRKLTHIADPNGGFIRINLVPFFNVTEFDMHCTDGFKRLCQQLVTSLPAVTRKLLITVPDPWAISISHICRLVHNIHCNRIVINANRVCVDVELANSNFNV